jgi:ABC-type nitrate/sulfonate/bicarbonate transport system ATPase subunit
VPEAIVRIRELDKSFSVDGKSVPILKNINLDIEEGEFVTIVGHSGCGKSTLLKIISGLVDYEIGSVVRNGQTVKEPGPDCGMVFQEHRLLPWLKVKDNIGFGLERLSKKDRKQRVLEYLQLVKLDGFGNVYPNQLSGGMSQRAAIARGLAANPSILLLDEPFGALDALTRIQMQKEILRIQAKEKTTMVMVTHDLDEAIVLGKRIIVMSARPGEIREIIRTETSAARQVGSSEFNYYKKKIYDYFFEDEKNEVEYNL